MLSASAASAEGLRYWDLHIFLLVPTAWLLTVGAPQILLGDAVGVTSSYGSLKQVASRAFILFILAISVAQAFIWDSVGAEIGIWEFNPAKCTGLGDATLLPVEEVAWLFHHVMKAALWQLKVAELEWTVADDAPSALPVVARDAGNWALGAVAIAGVYALVGESDSLKCVGLVAAFFAPVFIIIFNLGRRYWRSHWKLFLWGWLPPGLWTVCIDCLGQQQDVWFFPEKFLTGIDAFGGASAAGYVDPGWLKLDIAAVYLVSTLAVTATGAIIFAAIEEYAARGAQPPLPQVAVGALGTAQAATPATPSTAPNLWDLGLFIFDGAFPGAARWPTRVYLDQFLGREAAAEEQKALPAGSPSDSSSDSSSSRPAGRREII